ncbi:hypothetical protein M3612_18150 [Niallia taxi]|uniref:hypothetical protein n=1 Tax=Niallia taxi TaxID=2499688 RepID=UPI00203F0030|nr:hypothetical protein [Niallia taxi]MCM3216410.1 hypothetical protein [Niallia taxi]
MILLLIRKVDTKSKVILKGNNNLAFSLVVLICCVMLFIGISFVILKGNNIGRAGLGSIFEYFVMFACVGSMYVSNKKQKIVLTTIIILYCLLNLVLHGRIETLQSAFLLIIMYQSKLNFKKVTLIAIVGFALLSLMGNLRNDSNADFSIVTKRYNNMGQEYILSNQGDVLYSSAALHGLINDNVITSDERIKSFLEYVKRLVLPNNYVSSLGSLSSYSQQFTMTGGGGLISSYLFAWFNNYFLFILLVCIVLVNKIKFNSAYSILVLNIVIVTVPRWYAYDPITLVKMPLYGLVLFFILNSYTSYRGIIRQPSIKNVIYSKEGYGRKYV